jgi:hypothetical protein
MLDALDALVALVFSTALPRINGNPDGPEPKITVFAFVDFANSSVA